MLDEMLDAFESFQNLEKSKNDEKNHVGWCWMKFALDQTFHPTFSGSSNNIFMLDVFSSIILPLTLRWVQNIYNGAYFERSNVFFTIKTQRSQFLNTGNYRQGKAKKEQS